MRADLEVLSSADALAHAAATRVVTAAAAAIESHGQFVVALSGGSTPSGTYERLATEPLRSQVMWSRVHILWGDERCVPPDQSQSNYRMAREALLDRVPLPAEHVHPIHGEQEPAAAAALYERTVRTLLRTPVGPPRTIPGARIDLIILGLGDDGHTASLFPEGVAARERTRWVVAEYAAAVSMWRVTLTPVVINAAAEVLFLVSGRAKAPMVRRVIEGHRLPTEVPAQLIAPSAGRMRWFLDAAAAAALASRRP